MAPFASFFRTRFWGRQIPLDATVALWLENRIHEGSLALGRGPMGNVPGCALGWLWGAGLWCGFNLRTRLVGRGHVGPHLRTTGLGGRALS